MRRDRETERESESELDLKKKTTNKLKKGPEDGVFGQKVRETKRKALKAEAATSGKKKKVHSDVFCRATTVTWAHHR